MAKMRIKELVAKLLSFADELGDVDVVLYNSSEESAGTPRFVGAEGGPFAHSCKADAPVGLTAEYVVISCR